MATDNSITLGIDGLKTKQGLLKLVETILGAVCLGNILMSPGVTPDVLLSFDLFFYSVSCALSATLVLFLSYFMSPNAAEKLPNTLLELLHHGISFPAYTVTSIFLLAKLLTAEYSYSEEKRLMGTAVLGLVNSILYGGSLFYSYESFKAA